MCYRLGNRPTKCTIAYQQMSRCSIYVVIFKKPANCCAVCFFPHFYPLCFRQVLSLIEFCVAAKAEARDSVIMALNSSAFTVSKLVTVRCNHSSIVSSTMLTGGLSKDFKEFLVSVHEFLVFVWLYLPAFELYEGLLYPNTLEFYCIRWLCARGQCQVLY